VATHLAKPAIDVGLVTADATPLIDFYCGVAGLERLEPLVLPNIGTIHKLAAGQSILRVMVPTDPPEADRSASFSARGGIRYLTLEVVDIGKAVKAVRALGGRVDLEPFELRPGRQVAQVADPDGNMIELGQDS
jgi:glyoxylase I family protein